MISENSGNGFLPFVSVVMPIVNEERHISRSLRALLAQSYPIERMEIIIADGMSTDDTRRIVNEMAQNQRADIKIVDNPGKIAPKGLNVAIRHARGSIIVRVDGHCEVEHDYISNCVRELQDNDVEGVGGPIETVGETFQASAISLAMSSRFGVGNSAFRTVDDKKMFVDTVAFPGYTREILEKAGPFDEELVRNQDDEYNFRIRELGGRILLSPNIRSRYYSRSTFASLWRQYFQYGYWKVRVLQLHPRQMSFRHFVPAIFVSALAVSGAFALLWPMATFALLLIAGSYLISNLLASMATAIRRQPNAMILLPAIFAILHFSYGLGFLAGLLSFWRRWKR